MSSLADGHHQLWWSNLFDLFISLLLLVVVVVQTQELVVRCNALIFHTPCLLTNACYRLSNACLISTNMFSWRKQSEHVTVEVWTALQATCISALLTLLHFFTEEVLCVWLFILCPSSEKDHETSLVLFSKKKKRSYKMRLITEKMNNRLKSSNKRSEGKTYSLWLGL